MINGLITIGIFLIIQLVAAVWWSATISTKMDFVISSTSGVKKNLEDHVVADQHTFSTKAEVTQALIAHEKEVATALGFANKELTAMWKRIDSFPGGGR